MEHSWFPSAYLQTSCSVQGATAGQAHLPCAHCPVPGQLTLLQSRAGQEQRNSSTRRSSSASSARRSSNSNIGSSSGPALSMWLVQVRLPGRTLLLQTIDARTTSHTVIAAKRCKPATCDHILHTAPPSTTTPHAASPTIHTACSTMWRAGVALFVPAFSAVWLPVGPPQPLRQRSSLHLGCTQAAKDTQQPVSF